MTEQQEHDELMSRFGKHGLFGLLIDLIVTVPYIITECLAPKTWAEHKRLRRMS